MTLALQSVFSRASATVSNAGKPRWVVPPFPGEVPPDHHGAVGDCLLGMERTIPAGDALADNSRFPVDEDGHYTYSASPVFSDPGSHHG